MKELAWPRQTKANACIVAYAVLAVDFYNSDVWFWHLVFWKILMLNVFLRPLYV